MLDSKMEQDIGYLSFDEKKFPGEKVIVNYSKDIYKNYHYDRTTSATII